MCQLLTKLILVMGLRYYRPKIWNSLPFHIKSSENLEAFKSIIKNWNDVSCKCKVCQYHYVLTNCCKWSEAHYPGLFLMAFSRLTSVIGSSVLDVAGGTRSVSVDVFEKFYVSVQNQNFQTSSHTWLMQFLMF